MENRARPTFGRRAAGRAVARGAAGALGVAAGGTPLGQPAGARAAPTPQEAGESGQPPPQVPPPALPVEPPPPGTEHNPPAHHFMAGPKVHAFHHQTADFVITGRPVVPHFVRYYNSNDPRAGPLGPGWNHSYTARLIDPGDVSGAVVLVWPQGRSDRFEPRPDGTFEGLPLIDAMGSRTLSLARLDDSGDATYVVRDQMRSFTFDAYGRLLTTTWAGRAAARVTHDDAAWQLAQVQPQGGIPLTFHYDPRTGRLASVTEERGKIGVPAVIRFD